MNGGAIVDVVRVAPSKLWVDVLDVTPAGENQQCAVYIDPMGLPVDVGDFLYWHRKQPGYCYWTAGDNSRENVPVPQAGDFNSPHPDLARTQVQVRRTGQPQPVQTGHALMMLGILVASFFVINGDYA